MITVLKDKRILLGVTGSIACYKAADLASKLTQAGALVDVILTGSARQFITPLTFQSVTGRRAYVDDDLWGSQGHVTHIALGHAADLLVVAPATANTLARQAHGQADNLLCVTALAASCPLLLAPAMDGDMFQHPATQANLDILRQRGAIILGPASGHLASGLTGAGRMLEPAELLGHIRLALAQNGILAGKKVLVTAGGTQEAIDPVRLISNRSSGKQGFALAQAALDAGAQVILITAPVALETPVGARRLEVGSAAEMRQAVLENLDGADALIMAAAVADFRPLKPAAQKIKKEGVAPVIELERTADILLDVAAQKAQSGFPRLTVGFAAESEQLLKNASAKLNAKRLDMLAANDISAPGVGFQVDTNRVTLLFADGRQEALPLLSKTEVAEQMVAHIAGLLAGGAP